MFGREARNSVSRDFPAAVEVSGRVLPAHVRDPGEALRRVAWWLGAAVLALAAWALMSPVPSSADMADDATVQQGHESRSPALAQEVRFLKGTRVPAIRTALERALDNRTRQDLAFTLAKANIRLGLIDDDLQCRLDAAAALEKLTRRNPEESRFWLALGEAYEASVYHSRDTGSRSRADDAYQRAYQLDPANPQVRFARAERLLQDLRTDENTTRAIHLCAEMTTDLLSRAFLEDLPARVHLEGNLGSLAPFDPSGSGDTTLNAATLRERADYLGALASFFLARKLDRDRGVAPKESVAALHARVDALCAAAVKSLDLILAHDYAEHDSTYTNHAALLLEAAFAYRYYEQTSDPAELLDADQLFERGVQSLKMTDPYRYDCYRIPLDPRTKTFDPRWRDTGYPWELERSNPSQVGPVQTRAKYRYHLFQVDAYFGDVWLQLPLDVALRAPLAGVVLYVGYDFASIEVWGGAFAGVAGGGAAEVDPTPHPAGTESTMPSRADPPEPHKQTGYQPRYLVVNHSLLGTFTVFQDGVGINDLHGQQAIDEVMHTLGPAASIVAPDPETFLRDTRGFVTAVWVDKVPGQGTNPIVVFQVRIPSDVDSTDLTLRAALTGPDGTEIAATIARSPRFSERGDFLREPAGLGGRWVWRSSFGLPDRFVSGLSAEGEPCTVRLQLMRNDGPIPSAQVVTRVNVRPFPPKVFRLGDPMLPHFGLVHRGENLAVQVHTYEDMATSDSMHVTVPPECEIHAGSGQKDDDGSTSVVVRQGDGFVAQAVRIFAADGSARAPIVVKKSAFYLSDPNGFWGGGRTRTLTTVELPTSTLPVGQYIAVLTWQDAVSNSSSSVSTTFTVVENSTAESAKKGIQTTD